MSFLTGQSRKVTGQSMYTSVGWLVLGPSHFSQDVVFYGSFYRYFLQKHFVVCARKMIKKPQPTRMGNCPRPGLVALDHRVDRTSDPTSELVSMQPPAPESSLAEPPPAASPQLGRWICQQGLRSARMRCLLLVLAAARVLLLLLLLRRRLLFLLFYV